MILKIRKLTRTLLGKSNKYKFELFTDKAGEYRFRYVAPNNEIMFQSEGYAGIGARNSAVRSIQNTMGIATVVEQGKQLW